jgi:hypothetical protein
MRRKIFPGKSLLSVLIAYGTYFLTGCSDHSKNDAAIIRVMEEGLSNSNKSINASSETVLHSLDNKRMDPATSYKAEVWYPKAQQISVLSKDCYGYIKTLKKKPGLSANESSILFNKIKKYEEDILNIDPQIKKTFSDPAYLILPEDSLTISEKDFYNKFLKNTSYESTKAFLTKLQNTVKMMENKTLIFCNEQISYHRPYFDAYSVIIGQNCIVLNKGKQLEITAGVGAFSTKANPEITINGKVLLLNESGFTVYKKKITVNPGDYKIPIKIKYTDEFGKENIIEKIVEYTVAKECYDQ